MLDKDGNPLRNTQAPSNVGADDRSSACSTDSEEEAINNGTQLCDAVISPDVVPDDQAELVRDLGKISAHVELLSQCTSQKARRMQTRKQAQIKKLVAKIEDVSQKIASGDIVLPDPGENAVWSLYDSGSSIHAADHSEHFPWATLVDSSEPEGTYHSATWGTVWWQWGIYCALQVVQWVCTRCALHQREGFDANRWGQTLEQAKTNKSHP